MLESYFKIVAGLKVCNYIKKRLQHRCFSVNIAKFLRKPISKNICDRLLLPLVTYLAYGMYLFCCKENTVVAKIGNNQLIVMEIFHSRNTTFENIRKNIFPCLFSVHIKISLSRYEQNCLMRLLFEKYSFHHRVQWHLDICRYCS